MKLYLPNLIKGDKMDARAFLIQAEKYDAILRHKEEEYKYWQEYAVNISPNLDGTKVQTSWISDKIGRAVAEKEKIELEIIETINKAMRKRVEIIDTIEQLPVAEYDMLYKVYLQGMTVQEAAFQMEKSYRWATGTHTRALKNLQTILDNK